MRKPADVDSQGIVNEKSQGKTGQAVIPGLSGIQGRIQIPRAMIILFCGIPGSGKSTIAEILAKRLGVLGRVQMFSSDKLRGPVYRKFFKVLAPAERRADFIIFDATFYKKEWRDQVSALAQDEKVITVYLNCPLEIALKRNKERQPNISEKAVHIMFHQMEPPEKPTIVIDSATTTASDAAATIFELIKDQPGPALTS
jgi:adenylylsulfate kinase-like enzyme